MKTFFVSLFISASLFTQIAPPAPQGKLIVENRVLTRVDNEPISVIDVMKKMSVHFYINYPHLADSEVARFQFYKSMWRNQFDSMINDCLLVKEAETLKMSLSDGDIRQELERRFGPNIIVSLENIDLSYSEAFETIKTEMLAQQMRYRHLFFKGVFSPGGTQSVAPSDLLTAYQNFSDEHQRPAQWQYYIISFSGPNAFENINTSYETLKSLNEDSKNFGVLSKRFKSQVKDFEQKQISISRKLDLNSDQIQESHQEILNQLTANCLSEPVEDESRATNQPVYRVFYLDNHQPGGQIELSEVEQKLTQQIADVQFGDEQERYITSLRERYGMSYDSTYETIPADFEPFKFQ